MKLINKILALVLGFIVVYFTFKDNNFTYLFSLLVLAIPFIIKLPSITTCIYLIFVFSAMFLGSQVGIYRSTTWYDDISHIVWGYVSGILALYLLSFFKLNNKKIFFKVFFIIIISLASSVVWEIFEYGCDVILNTNMQRIQTGVEDTMMDIINALLGNLLFCINFIYEQTTKKQLLINKIIGEIK